MTTSIAGCTMVLHSFQCHGDLSMNWMCKGMFTMALQSVCMCNTSYNSWNSLSYMKSNFFHMVITSIADEGQALASNEEHGLLSSLREPGQVRPVQHASWLEPINVGWLIHESIANGGRICFIFGGHIDSQYKITYEVYISVLPGTTWLQSSFLISSIHSRRMPCNAIWALI